MANDVPGAKGRSARECLHFLSPVINPSPPLPVPKSHTEEIIRGQRCAQRIGMSPPASTQGAFLSVYLHGRCRASTLTGVDFHARFIIANSVLNAELPCPKARTNQHVSVSLRKSPPHPHHTPLQSSAFRRGRVGFHSLGADKPFYSNNS